MDGRPGATQLRIPQSAPRGAGGAPSILHLLAPGEVGGLERVVQMLAAAQQRAGSQVTVAAVLDPGRSEHPLLEALRGVGVATRALVPPLRAYHRERRMVAELLQQVRPDVVHVHGYRADVIGAPVARRLGVATTSTVHGFTGGGWKNRLYERLQRRAFRRMDAVVAVSRPLHETLARDGIPSARLHLVPNAWAPDAAPLPRVAARRALGIGGDGVFRIGWVGRTSAEKGADVLIEALPALADVPLAVSIVGDGRERAGLEARAAVLGAADRIDWHGLVPDAGRHFSAFDAFVLSSRTEGTPIVLFEAMAAGVPVVATRVGGVPDVVSPAEALLVEPEAPRALAAAIRAVWRDPGAATTRAAAARERLASAFGPEAWVARYSDIYHQICGSTREARR